MTPDRMETEEDVEAVLVARLEELVRDAGGKTVRVRSFESAHLLTSDRGVVLRVDGAEYQISITKSA